MRLLIKCLLFSIIIMKMSGSVIIQNVRPDQVEVDGSGQLSLRWRQEGFTNYVATARAIEVPTVTRFDSDYWDNLEIQIQQERQNLNIKVRI